MAYTVEDYQSNRKGPVSILIYGMPGSGKTSFGASFPNPLVIDTDRGLKSVAHKVRRINLDKLNAYEQVVEILTDASRDLRDFAAGKPLNDVGTLLFDSGTTLCNEYLMGSLMMKAPESRKSEGPKFEEFQRLKNQMIQIGSLIKQVAEKRNVIMTATPLTEEDELRGVKLARPDFMGSFREMVGAMFDEVYFMHAMTINGESRFKLYASDWKYYSGKTRLLSKTEIDWTGKNGYETFRANLKA